MTFSALQYFNESILDAVKPNLDPKVFHADGNGIMILNDVIKAQIESDLAKFDSIVPSSTSNIVGSILTKSYNDRSDIDVNVVYDKEDVDPISANRLMILLRSINGRLGTGTTHPINYYLYFSDGTDYQDRFDGIYDFKSNKWLKIPEPTTIKIDKYLGQFMNAISSIDITTMAIRRDLIDIRDLQDNLTAEDIKGIKDKLQSKVFEVEEKIKSLVASEEIIKKARRAAFNKPITKNELLRLKSKNLLPENVIYKLLEKYYYLKFINKLNELLSVGITMDTVDELKDITDDFLTDSQMCEVGLILLEERKMRELKDPSKPSTEKERRRKSKSMGDSMYRGVDRKNLKQIPDWKRADFDINYRGEKVPELYGHGSFSAKDLLHSAKTSKSGQWVLNKNQARWIANMYGMRLPTRQWPVKHLSNMPIVLWKRKNGDFYLVKNRFTGVKHHHHDLMGTKQFSADSVSPIYQGTMDI